MSRALCASYRFKEKVRTTGRAFIQWKMFSHFSSLRKQHHHLVDTKINNKYLKKAWNSWMATHNEMKKKKVENEKRKEAEDYVEMISMKYQKEISNLQSKLSETLAELHAVNQNKKDMQNQLKRAFMRGLCAMNLEAMDVLNPEDANQLGMSNLIMTEDTQNQPFHMDKNLYSSINKGGKTPTIENEYSRDKYGQSQALSTTQRTVNPEYTSVNRLGQPDFAGLIPQDVTNKKTNIETTIGKDKDKFNTIDITLQQSIKREYPGLDQSLDDASHRMEGAGYSSSNNKKPYDYNQYSSKSNPVDNNNVDDMYENMLKEFRMKQQTTSSDESKSINIINQPLAESKEHMWKQAPIINTNSNLNGSKDKYKNELDINFPPSHVQPPIPHSISQHSSDNVHIKSILKNNNTSKQTNEYNENSMSIKHDHNFENDSDDEGQIIKYQPEDLKKSQVSHHSIESSATVSRKGISNNGANPKQQANSKSINASKQPVSASIGNRIQKKTKI